MTMYKGFDLDSKHDQFGMIAAAKYEMEHANDADNRVLKRAKQLREIWEKSGVFHVSTITSVMHALGEL